MMICSTIFHIISCLFLKISSVMPPNPALFFISITSSIQLPIASCIASLLASFSLHFYSKAFRGRNRDGCYGHLFIFLSFLPHSFVISEYLNNPLFEWSFKAEFGKRLLKTFLSSLKGVMHPNEDIRDYLYYLANDKEASTYT